MYHGSVQKHGTLHHLHSIDFAEKFVPFILELPQEDDGVDVLIAAPFCHLTRKCFHQDGLRNLVNFKKETIKAR